MLTVSRMKVSVRVGGGGGLVVIVNTTSVEAVTVNGAGGVGGLGGGLGAGDDVDGDGIRDAQGGGPEYLRELSNPDGSTCVGRHCRAVLP